MHCVELDNAFNSCIAGSLETAMTLVQLRHLISLAETASFSREIGRAHV